MSARGPVALSIIVLLGACASSPKETRYPGSGFGRVETHASTLRPRGLAVAGQPNYPLGWYQVTHTYEVRAKDGTLHLIFSDDVFSIGECVAFHGFSDGPSRTQWSRERVSVASSNACDSSYQLIEGGQRVEQSGVSFVLPPRRGWAAIIRSTHQAAFGASGMLKDETLLVAYSLYDVETFETREEFLSMVRTWRSGSAPGRYERLRNEELLFTDRPETCVVYRSASKDFGLQARRGGEYSIFETIGMHCAHPDNPRVGIQVELSRKAPPGMTYPAFDADAMALLHSVRFDSL